jgi:hypothetical protein
MASDRFLAFMDGVTCAGLFGKLRRPGAPTELIDSRTVEQYLASGEFEETLSRLGVEVPERIGQLSRSRGLAPQNTKRQF